MTRRNNANTWDDPAFGGVNPPMGRGDEGVSDSQCLFLLADGMPAPERRPVTERKPSRAPVLVNRRYIPGPDCIVCGYKAVNVRHERDPQTAPEGPEYYADFLDELHEFVGPTDDA